MVLHDVECEFAQFQTLALNSAVSIVNVTHGLTPLNDFLMNSPETTARSTGAAEN